MQYKLTTTLNLIKSHDPCSDGLETLTHHLGLDFNPDDEINLLDILDSNGISHMFWCFRAVKQDYLYAKKCAVTLSIKFTESVLHIFEEKLPNDKRPRLAIQSIKNWVDNPCGDTMKLSRITRCIVYDTYCYYNNFRAYYGDAVNVVETAFSAVRSCTMDDCYFVFSSDTAFFASLSSACTVEEREKQKQIIRDALIR